MMQITRNPWIPFTSVPIRAPRDRWASAEPSSAFLASAPWRRAPGLHGMQRAAQRAELLTPVNRPRQASHQIEERPCARPRSPRVRRSSGSPGASALSIRSRSYGAAAGGRQTSAAPSSSARPRPSTRLREDLVKVFDAGRSVLRADPQITGRRPYAEAERLAAESGWTLGGWHAGHLVGEFPHETIDGAAPGSTSPWTTPLRCDAMRRAARAGRCHWILEVHLVDEQHGFGGFYGQLLDLA